MMLDVAIEADPEWDSSAGWDGLIRTAAEAAIFESAYPQLAGSARNFELSVRLTGDDEVRALNAQWRGKDKPTNILSFPQLDPRQLENAAESGPELMLGDLVLARGVCEREAGEKAIPIERHAAHLIVHGTLHLLGYDHQDEQSAIDMESREVRALARLGISDPTPRAGTRDMATRNDDNGSRLWRGMRALIFGDEETTLRDQIEEAMDEADETGAVAGDLSPHERQMLRNLLHFGDETAGDISVTRGDIVSVPATIAFDDLVKAFAEAEHSRLPVYGDSLDEIVGMVHIKDLFAALIDETRDRSINALMRMPLFVPESMGVIDLLARMRAERIHLAIVVDEFGGTEGLVTIEDVVEEIVGEIEDEHDIEAAGLLTRLDDGVWEADARVELEELAEAVDARFRGEDDDVDTLGGLVFLLAGHIPARGETVIHPSGWRLEAVDSDPRRILRVRLHAPEAETEAG
jgi:rRNA maturation RNase YbeY